MTDKDNAPPSSPIPPDLSQSDFDRISGRIDELESLLSNRILTGEDEERNLRVSELKQRIAIRKWTSFLATLVVLFMLCLIVRSQYFSSNWWVLWTAETYSIFLIAVPTVSITTIVVALLFGAFRRFKDDDPESVSGSTPLNGLISQLTGHSN